MTFSCASRTEAYAALRVSIECAIGRGVGRLRFVLVAGVLCSACGSGARTPFEPASEDPQVVNFDSKINVCPEFLGSAVNPTEITPKQTTALLVLATDPDGDDSKLEFEWSADSGVFSARQRALTEYRCGKAGVRRLHAIARDTGGCVSSMDIAVTCLAE